MIPPASITGHTAFDQQALDQNFGQPRSQADSDGREPQPHP
jgi:hypothetical protein